MPTPRDHGGAGAVGDALDGQALVHLVQQLGQAARPVVAAVQLGVTRDRRRAQQTGRLGGDRLAPRVLQQRGPRLDVGVVGVRAGLRRGRPSSGSDSQPGPNGSHDTAVRPTECIA
uniref:hypothetical protein n=1 Tax=Saccharothrix espanaensis TaxID=103731 RepID=UPI003F493112